jgi:ParB family chromosome partitioning protein
MPEINEPEVKEETEKLEKHGKFKLKEELYLGEPYLKDGILVMKISDIVTKPPFKILFAINSNTLESVKENMKSGYDNAYPVVVWRNIVVDGHTRLEAAKSNKLKVIPVLVKQFKDEQEALEYSLHNQRDRRNITEAELLSAIAIIDKPLTKAEAGAKGGKGEGKKESSHKTTAKALGIKESKVAAARAVLKDEGAIEEVKSGKKTIGKAATDLRKKKKPSKPPVKPLEAIYGDGSRIDSVVKVLKDNAGNMIERAFIVEESDGLYLKWNEYIKF